MSLSEKLVINTCIQFCPRSSIPTKEHYQNTIHDIQSNKYSIPPKIETKKKKEIASKFKYHLIINIYKSTSVEHYDLLKKNYISLNI